MNVWPRSLDVLVQIVKLAQTQFVFGLANGWAGDYQSLLMYPQSVVEAWEALQAVGITPRGSNPFVALSIDPFQHFDYRRCVLGYQRRR